MLIQFDFIEWLKHLLLFINALFFLKRRRKYVHINDIMLKGCAKKKDNTEYRNKIFIFNK